MKRWSFFCHASIVLIGIDTFRYDYLKYAENLTEFADGSVLYTNAFAQSSWTLPSFASIFTGTYPEEHGAMTSSGKIHEDVETITEYLQGKGYECHAIVCNPYLGERGFERGFDTYKQLIRDDLHELVTSEVVTDWAIKHIQDATGELFLFAHYFDPHYNYKNHPEYKIADWYKGPLLDMDVHAMRCRTKNKDDLEYIRDLYREEIYYTDYHIGRLLDEIPAKMNVIVVSDHGEELGEAADGWVGHLWKLSDAIIHVPMIVRRANNHQGSIVDGIVEARSVYDILKGMCDGVTISPSEGYARSVVRKDMINLVSLRTTAGVEIVKVDVTEDEPVVIDDENLRALGYLK